MFESRVTLLNAWKGARVQRMRSGKDGRAGRSSGAREGAQAGGRRTGARLALRGARGALGRAGAVVRVSGRSTGCTVHPSARPLPEIT
ncbi:hypothetical protein CRG98_005371 [Punica granatum]|nr:hypothetical protein CRG98_005371 [Punica granatum]